MFLPISAYGHVHIVPGAIYSVQLIGLVTIYGEGSYKTGGGGGQVKFCPYKKVGGGGADTNWLSTCMHLPVCSFILDTYIHITFLFIITP